MAIRRLNFTGRKKINRSDVAITVREHEREASTFEAVLSLEEYELPPDAKVYIEAHRQTSYMRFEFGTAAQPKAQDELTLSEFDTAEGVLFRIKVTSSDEPCGLLLATAEQIRPRAPEQTEERRIPLLTVRPDPGLAQQVWRLDFTGASGPVLCVSSRAGDHHAILRHPLVQSLVLPAVLREILNRVVHIEEHWEVDPEGDWMSQWLKFATNLPGSERDLPAFQDEAVRDTWIDDVVASFCRALRSTDQFVSSFEAVP